MQLIHIGTPKTASTLIQKVLLDEREALAALHINVPDIGWDCGRGHYGFRQSLNRKFDGDPAWESLREKFRLMLSDARTNHLLSSETLWPVNPSALLRVYPELSGTKILFFCREQSSIIFSHYFQKIKGGDETRSQEEFFDDEKDLYDYHRAVVSWEEAFGPGNVQPLLYEKAMRERGVLPTFLSRCFELLGLTEADGQEILGRVSKNSTKSNVKMPAVVAAMLLMVNRSAIPAKAKRILKEEVLAAPDRYHEFAGTGLTIDPALKARIRAHYRKSNIKLFERFFGGRSDYDAFWG